MVTWGCQFQHLRQRSLGTKTTASDVVAYVAKRAFGFCEACGMPGSTLGDYPHLSVEVVGKRLCSSHALCLCPSCTSHWQKEKLLSKAQWIEHNLDDGTLLYVTAAVIVDDGKVLICQKPHTGLWEFPGGKLDEGEGLVAGLQREVQEELNLQVGVTDPVALVDHDYGHVKIRLFGLMCCTPDFANLELREHLASRWCSLSELQGVGFSAADVVMARKLEGLVSSPYDT